MAQLNLYVPDEVIERLRSGAKREGKSLSSFVGGILDEKTKTAEVDWDSLYARLDSHGPVLIELTEEERNFGGLREIDLD
ncbi:MAG: hypothetical protein FJW36_19450 [Acidobacteria bacterium]|nr:hypothetical protein [Acidobacteriota bacterium]